jgi:hypothetical protein
MLQINFAPAHDSVWKKDLSDTVKILTSGYPQVIKKILFHPAYKYVKILFFPFFLLGKLVTMVVSKSDSEEPKSKE